MFSCLASLLGPYEKDQPLSPWWLEKRARGSWSVPGWIRTYFAPVSRGSFQRLADFHQETRGGFTVRVQRAQIQGMYGFYTRNRNDGLDAWTLRVSCSNQVV